MHASGLTNRPPSLPAEQGQPWLRREGRGPPMDIQRGARGAQGMPQMAQASPRSRRGGRREGGRGGGADAWAQGVSCQLLKRSAFSCRPSLTVKILLESRKLSFKWKLNFKNEFSIQQRGKKKIQKPASPVFQIEPFAAPSLRLFRPIFFFFFLPLNVFMRSFMKRFFSNAHKTSILMVSINRHC